MLLPVLLALAPFQEAAPMPSEFAADLARASATLSAAVLAVEVGEPMTWTLDVIHPDYWSPRLSDDDLGLGERYVVLDASGTLTSATPERGDGLLLTRKSWTVIVLGPTELLPSMEVFFDVDGKPVEEDGAPSIFTSEVELQVRTLVAADEVGRPAKGFRGPLSAADTGASVPWWVVAGGAPIALLILALIIRRMRGVSRTAVVTSLPPLERLAQLEQSVSADLPALQALHYSLTSLLREAFDARAGQVRAPLTDAEWVVSVQGDADLASDVRDALRDVIGRAEEVKYARQKPTKFAVDETLRAARVALEAETHSGGKS